MAGSKDGYLTQLSDSAAPSEEYIRRGNQLMDELFRALQVHVPVLCTSNKGNTLFSHFFIIDQNSSNHTKALKLQNCMIGKFLAKTGIQQFWPLTPEDLYFSWW